MTVLSRGVLAIAAGYAALGGLTTISSAQDANEFKDGEGMDVVRTTCTRCHSAAMVTQNSGSREVWQLRINTMQSSHGMPAIDDTTESTILDYLETHYGQKTSSRRAPLSPHLMPANPYEVDSVND